MADITDLIKNYTKLQYLTFVPEIKLFTDFIQNAPRGIIR